MPKINLTKGNAKMHVYRWYQEDIDAINKIADGEGTTNTGAIRLSLQEYIKKYKKGLTN